MVKRGERWICSASEAALGDDDDNLIIEEIHGKCYDSDDFERSESQVSFLNSICLVIKTNNRTEKQKTTEKKENQNYLKFEWSIRMQTGFPWYSICLLACLLVCLFLDRFFVRPSGTHFCPSVGLSICPLRFCEKRIARHYSVAGMSLIISIHKEISQDATFPNWPCFLTNAS